MPPKKFTDYTADLTALPVETAVDGNYVITVVDKDGGGADVHTEQQVKVNDLVRYVSAEAREKFLDDAINAGDIDEPSLRDLTTASAATVSIEAAAGTDIGTLVGKRRGSTLAIDPEGFFTLDGTTIDKGTSPFTTVGTQVVSVTETSAYSSVTKTTGVPVTITRPPLAVGEPFTPDSFSEYIYHGWVQEDLPVGKVAEWRPRGIRVDENYYMTNSSPEGQPTKLPNNGGVSFTPGTSLKTLRGNGDVLAAYRWMVQIFKVNISADQVTTRFLECNTDDGVSEGHFTPRVIYESGVGIQTRTTVKTVPGEKTNLTHTITDFHDDGSKWNILVWCKRRGKIFCNFNGVDIDLDQPQLSRLTHHNRLQNETSMLHEMNRSGVGEPWIGDAFIIGQTEMNEAQYYKMVAWAHHRVGQQADLPESNPYKSSMPVIEASDLPYTYQHDETQWSNFMNYLDTNNTDTGSLTRANIGQDRALDDTGWTQVFNDDFRFDTVYRSDSDVIIGADQPPRIWNGFGWNTGVAKNYSTSRPDTAPDQYVHDPVNKTLELSVLGPPTVTTWRAAAINSVDESGNGYAWGGERKVRIRFLLPDRDPATELAQSLFPAMVWQYNLEALLNRVQERLEWDPIELDGKDHDWLNGGSFHAHQGEIKGYLTHRQSDGDHEKVFGGSMSGRINAASRHLTENFSWWDGKWKDFEFIITNTTTYANLGLEYDGDGNLFLDGSGNPEKRWFELYRFPTPPQLLEVSYLNSNYAMFTTGTRPDDLATPLDKEWFKLDYVQVWYPDARVTEVPTGFTARPTIAGTAQDGQTLTATANAAAGITHIEYEFRDESGYILQEFSGLNTYIVKTKDVGVKIRCMIKLAGAVNQPEAYTDLTATVIAA